MNKVHCVFRTVHHLRLKIHVFVVWQSRNPAFSTGNTACILPHFYPEKYRSKVTHFLRLYLTVILFVWMVFPLNCSFISCFLPAILRLTLVVALLNRRLREMISLYSLSLQTQRIVTVQDRYLVLVVKLFWLLQQTSLLDRLWCALNRKAYHKVTHLANLRTLIISFYSLAVFVLLRFNPAILKLHVDAFRYICRKIVEIGEVKDRVVKLSCGSLTSHET